MKHRFRFAMMYAEQSESALIRFGKHSLKQLSISCYYQNLMQK